MAMAPDTPRKDASNRFDYLLNLATCAFGGDEDAAESWLLTVHPEIGEMPLGHARTEDGMRQVERILQVMMLERVKPKRH